MSDYFENINLQDIDLAEYNSIDIGFTREQKENLKKELRKKITKRKSKKNSIAAAVAVVLITAAVFSNGSNVLAKVEPRFNEIYENLGFKKQYLSEKDYVGKTYENNGIKVTLDNFVVSKHLAQFALKVQYSDKWTSSQRSQISCGLDFHWKFGGFTDINTKTIDGNTELKVVSYTSQDELKKKGKYTIKVTSDDFNEPIVWNMNIDFSKNFSKTIERQVTMLKDLGINIKKIEADKDGAVIISDYPVGFDCYFKIGNKYYPDLGGGTEGPETGKSYNVIKNINYDVIKSTKNASLVKYIYKYNPEDDTSKMTEEQLKKWKDNYSRSADEESKQLDSAPKGEIQGVTYTKEFNFTNGNKAEIYKIERKNGKIRVYIKGDNKKQVFQMSFNLYTSYKHDALIQCIEETKEGYILDFNDFNDKVTIIPIVGILNCNGDYTLDESKLKLK